MVRLATQSLQQLPQMQRITKWVSNAQMSQKHSGVSPKQLQLNPKTFFGMRFGKALEYSRTIPDLAQQAGGWPGWPHKACNGFTRLATQSLQQLPQEAQMGPCRFAIQHGVFASICSTLPELFYSSGIIPGLSEKSDLGASGKNLELFQDYSRTVVCQRSL